MAPLTKLAYRIVVVALALLAVLAQLIHLDSLTGGLLGLGGSGIPRATSNVLAVMTGDAVVTAGTAALAVALVFRGDPARGALPLAACLAAWAYLLSYPGMVILAEPYRGAAARMMVEGHYPLVEALGLVTFLRFTALFPTRLAPEVFPEPEGLAMGVGFLQLVQRGMLNPALPWILIPGGYLAVMGLTGASGAPLQEASLHPLADIIRFIAITLAVLNLWRSLTTTGDAGRTRLKWSILGFVVLVGLIGVILGGNVLVAVTGWELSFLNWRPLLLDVAVLGLLWGQAMAILYDGPLSPDRLVRRATVLSAQATGALFLAAGLEALADLLVAIPLPTGSGTVFAGAVVVLVGGRVGRLLEGALDRLPPPHRWQTPAD